jgi:hypothetical protein
MMHQRSWIGILALSGAFAVTGCTSSTDAPAPEAAAPAAAEAAAEAPAPEAPAAAEAEEAEAVPTHEISTEIAVVDGVRTLVASVTPLNGYKINLEFPWSLKVREDAPVAAGLRMGSGDAAEFGEETARFAIPADGDATGDVLADLRLSVCNDVGCLTPRAEVEWTLASAE